MVYNYIENSGLCYVMCEGNDVDEWIYNLDYNRIFNDDEKEYFSDISCEERGYSDICYFNDSEIKNFINAEDVSEEFINFINYFDIVEFRTIPKYFFGLNFDFGDITYNCLIPVIKYYNCKNDYEKLCVFGQYKLENLDLFEICDNLMHVSIKNGNLNGVKWLQENGCSWGERAFEYASGYGNFDIMKWLKDNGCPWNAHTFMYAAAYGNLDIMKWMKENGCPWNESAFAAAYGNLDSMKWLKENGCPWNESAFTFAAAHGNLDIMKWLKENGCPWNESAFTFAAKHGNLDIMKWMKENGCPWDESTFEYPVRYGKLDIIKWLKENGCPWDERTFFVL